MALCKAITTSDFLNLNSCFTAETQVRQKIKTYIHFALLLHGNDKMTYYKL